MRAKKATELLLTRKKHFFLHFFILPECSLWGYFDRMAEAGLISNCLPEHIWDNQEMLLTKDYEPKKVEFIYLFKSKVFYKILSIKS